MTTLKKMLLIWVGALVLFFVAMQFIVTDSKRVHRVVKACEEAARTSQADKLMAQIAPDYEYQGMDWATLEVLARAIFRKNEFSRTVLYNRKIKVEGEVADVRFSAMVRPSHDSKLPGSFTGWRLKMEKRDKKWLITEIEMVTLNGNNVGTLRQMMEQAASMGGE